MVRFVFGVVRLGFGVDRLDYGVARFRFGMVGFRFGVASLGFFVSNRGRSVVWAFFFIIGFEFVQMSFFSLTNNELIINIDFNIHCIHI